MIKKIFNKRINILFLAILLSLTIPNVHATARPNVVVSSFEIKEGVANPGKDMTLKLTLIDTEPASCAKAITVAISSKFPFTMKGVTTQTAGDLCFGQVKTVEFPLKIDASAVGGFYQATVLMSYESTLLDPFSGQSVINIDVSGTPEIGAYIANSMPVDVYPGDSATITLAITNQGTYQAQSVNATLLSESNERIIVKKSRSFGSFVTLPAKSSQTIDFEIEVPKDAETGDVPLILSNTYLDENLERVEQKIPLLFNVRNKARFLTENKNSDSIIKSDLLYSNENGKRQNIILKNIGTDNARKVTMKVLPEYPFSTDGSTRYTEIIETNNEVPFDFTVDVDKDAKPGTYVLDLLVDWEDATGKKFQDTTQMTLSVVQKDMFRAVFIDYAYIWGVVCLIILITVMTKIKKKK